jgi:hypothetical protein
MLVQTGNLFNLTCSLNACFLFRLTANCQLLIIIRGMIALRLGSKEKI